MINPSACVPISISSRDVGVQATSAPGAARQRAVRVVGAILLVAAIIIMVELVQWGLNHLPAASAPTPGREEKGVPINPFNTVTVRTTTTTTTVYTTTADDIDGRVKRFMEDLRRERLQSRLQPNAAAHEE